MEEEIVVTQHQQQLSTTTTTLTTTPSTTLTTTSKKPVCTSSSQREVVVERTGGGGGGGDSSDMGGNRSGSTSSSVGWMGEGGGEGGSNSTHSSGSTVKTPTTPRQPSNRDSGYHTDFSPATFSTSQHHFTFDTADFPATLTDTKWGSSSSQQQGSSSSLGSSPMGSAPSLPGRSSLTISPGWQPRRVLPDVDSDDEGDDDAFVSDNVTVAATSHLPGLQVTVTPSSRGQSSRSELQSSRSELSCALLSPASRRQQSSHDDTDGKTDDHDDDRLASLRLRGDVEEERRRSNRSSPRSVAFRGLRRVVAEDDSCSEGEDGQGDGVSCTDYHRAPLSLVTLPGGERIRPLLARTIATQTPHLHCQLIDQILDCPQHFPQNARGSAVRRLRYYSEGEESVGVSSLARGPLPDIVPVTQGHRERSLSAPDLESLQRQRVAAREVGRELRRISDEFVRNHEALRDNHHGALAALHAELNGVAAFFLTGVRRFLYRGFAGYFRHVFHWTRQAMAASDTTAQPQPRRLRRDSSVDRHR